VSRSGKISVLAVFPTISEVAAPLTLGPTQTTPVTIDAQPVPDSVTVGPDGALYVGELGGEPFDVGTSSVYRVVPGHTPKVYASGFTAIGDIAFDHWGHLLVLEIDTAGLNDPAAAGGGLPTPGAIIRVDHNGSQTTVASTGLEFPTGMAVAPNGAVYVSNFGVISATGGPGGVSGEVVRVGLSTTGNS
jgi:sugar lactone lactonase YvrE